MSEHDDNLWRIARFIEPSLTRAEFDSRLRQLRREALIQTLIRVALLGIVGGLIALVLR